MKYVVFLDGQSSMKEYTSEEIALFIQQFREQAPDKSVKVMPFIPVGSLVLNKTSCETRIVKNTDYYNGTVTLYNTDNAETAERQKYGYLCVKHEEWDMNDCILLSTERMRELGFQFESEMGRHKDLHKIEWEEWFDSIFG